MDLQLQITRIKKAVRILKSKRLALAFFRHGVFAGAEHYSVLNCDLNTVIDIGANKGQFALACREWAPDAKIISFEPLERPGNIFKALFSQDSNVTLYSMAVGPSEMRTLIHISAHEDSSSLLPIGPNQVAYYPGTNESSVAEIKVAPLSSCLNVSSITRPAMLKIDVQGYEIEALRGCESIFEMIDYIYCECSFVELYIGQKLAHEVIDWLGTHCFHLSGVFNTSYDNDGQAIQADFLFKRRSS